MISNPHRKEGTKMKKAYTIGIADGSAGGKSTFAQRLQAALSDLEVLLLPMDAYFKPEGDRPTATGRTGRSYRDDNNPESFDLPRLRRDVSDAAEKFKRFANSIIKYGILSAKTIPIEEY